jgi:hypothetical protein
MKRNKNVVFAIRKNILQDFEWIDHNSKAETLEECEQKVKIYNKCFDFLNINPVSRYSACDFIEIKVLKVVNNKE